MALELLETDLVFSSCGTMVQGTPDGGFKDAEGLLRLVQVVRVPLLPALRHFMHDMWWNLYGRSSFGLSWDCDR